MATGPKSAPAALKLMKGRGNGTDSGGRKVGTPPPFRRVAPEPPEWMSDEAAAEWRRVVPELQRLDLVKAPDAAALTAYCESWARFVDACRLIRERGMTHPTSQGESVAPWVGIAERAGREIRAFAAEFGLTPAAEMKLAKVGDSVGGEESNPYAVTG